MRTLFFPRLLAVRHQFTQPLLRAPQLCLFMLDFSNIQYGANTMTATVIRLLQLATLMQPLKVVIQLDAILNVGGISLLQVAPATINPWTIFRMNGAQ